MYLTLKHLDLETIQNMPEDESGLLNQQIDFIDSNKSVLFDMIIERNIFTYQGDYFTPDYTDIETDIEIITDITIFCHDTQTETILKNCVFEVELLEHLKEYYK
tara:strand:- start:30611 stop:30922 length:312 start_codon:yes stop_codon:yes gene_type:complete